METLQRTANRGSISTGPYQIDNSLKFEEDNTEMMEQNPSAGGNRRTFTVSLWMKRSEISTTGNSQWIIGAIGASETAALSIDPSDVIFLDVGLGSTRNRMGTTQVFRDTSAWYHLVWRVDTTQGTAADRNRLYVNGVLAPLTAVDGYPTQNFECEYNNDKLINIGHYQAVNNNGLCGYLAEIHSCDGVSNAPTEFGEFDADSGIWKPKAYAGSYGAQGFYLPLDNSSDLGANSKGNSVDFTLQNITAADQATDTPTNNFTTWNTIRYYNGGDTVFKDGGTVVDNNFDGGFSAVNNNIRIGKGKWYAEFQITVSGNVLMNGNVDADYIDNDVNAAFYLGSQSDKTAGAGYYSSGTSGNDTIYYEGGSVSSGVTTSTGDIISVAMDCDNNKVHFAVNGAYTNSSNPATNTNGFAMTDNEQYFALASIGVRDYKANFGGYTASSISSAASDANGYGTFEYAPPSGYYALCTKNLAEYG